MEKKTFVDAILAIKKQNEIDCKIAADFGKVFTECWTVNLLPNTDTIVNGMIKVLEIEMKDTQTKWIDHFLYELDFGRENYRLEVTQNSKIIPLSTPTQLYNYLKKNLKT